MPIRVCVAGATGWTGSLVTRRILGSSEFQLVGTIARRDAGRDVGEALGMPAAGVRITGSLEEALQAPADVVIDYTHPDSVKARTLARAGLWHAGGCRDLRPSRGGLRRDCTAG